MSIRTQTFVGTPDDVPGPIRLPSPVEDETDDDVLLAKLAARAWNPGQRHDQVWIPTAWIAEHYGPERVAQWCRTVPRYADGTGVELPAQAEEVAAYFAGAERGPVFPPASAADVEAAERRIGYALPDLLRRVYTEIGDGGFGPDFGLVSLRRGQRMPGDLTDWPSVHTDRTHRYGAPPRSWLLLAFGGCSMEWHLSLTAVGNPVLLYDADGWEAPWGQNPHDGLRHAMPLRRWLSIWANNGQVWDDVLAACS
ncbi:SMI1/KNR4 family protein [Streptodolium elevatio]|uniref:Knr4/Smi1-like domain-containing protein n=1 Tax=Streptodolium elevatio TaxID=3157996 RepID=A0ABV3DSV6_9ACTN